MSATTYSENDATSDAPLVNLATPDARPAAAGEGDGGRVILEALVGLALVAIAVVSWGRASLTATRAEAAADHREVALELATNALEEMTVAPWSTAAIDPTSPGAVRRFEGRSVVTGPGGVSATTTVERDGRTFEIGRHITDSGNDAWRHAIVIVGWSEGERDLEVRLDGALRRPDSGAGP